ncbi:MAG: NAD-dependent epimerase/dehydratase family protein [Atopostipes suicloacalis]|nr:NAD-dependent epimerase/dehydratase family protein [Atopostipes suicloacalis]MDN6731566.1 NAD-dependent epimerase/dehydratase family protein [Atopostipes suicloacalis]
MKKVLVLGGTGLLGYHTVEELLERGYGVKSLALPPMPADDLFSSDKVESILANINDYSDEEILALLEDVDGLMYAIGADERMVPEAPAYSFFYEANVLPTQRLARLAAKAGVESFVIYGSYFAEFAERIDDVDLKSEAYPSTRLLQEQVAFAEGEGKMRVSSLRLPYIFGSMPGRMPLWKMFADRVINQEVFPVLEGGTAAVTVKQVAQAAVGALEKGEHRGTYALGGINISHKEFMDRIVKALGQEETTNVPVVPLEAVMDKYRELDEQTAAAGKEHGIHMEMNAEMNSRNLFIDPTEVMKELGYEEDDVNAAIEETLEIIKKEYE